MGTPIRLGIIGCGGMEKAHEQGLAGLEDRMRVTAVCDRVPERAERAKAILGAARAVTDFREMLDEVDAVLIVLPHHLHHPVGMACLEAGRHVLMEKPLANTEQQCLELIEAAERRNRILMVGYVQRYNPLVVKTRELIQDGTLGDVFQVSIWTEQWTRFPEEKSWGHRIATLGGGQLFSHGCHYVDLLLWFLGRPVSGTHSGTNFGTPWMEREGTSHLVMRFENGSLGYHFGTWGARGSRLQYSCHVHGTKAMLDTRLKEGKIFLTTWEKGETLIYEADPGKHTRRQMEHFLSCLECGHKPLTDGRSSLQSLRIIWRLYEAEERRIVADLRGLGLEDAHAG